MSCDIDRIVKALQAVLPPGERPLGLHEPEFGQKDRAYVLDCIDSTFVSSVGQYVDRFEAALADFTGARKAIAVVNGTAALHVALSVLGVKTGDEVIIPSLTFIATANAVSYCGARPHFADSNEATLGLDPEKLDRELARVAEISGALCRNRATGARIAAVVPMHVFGHPVDMDGLIEVAARWRLPIIEDAAESLGSYYKGKHTGRFGVMGIFSFNGNKTITTGGGGAVITDDPQIGSRLKHLTTTARVAHPWAFSHDEIGYNYRMPNLNAALGCAQLERLPAFLTEKRALAGLYRRAFACVDGVRFLDEARDTKSNFWLNALLLDREDRSQLDALLERTNALGIGTRPLWTLMHKLPMYADCPRMDLSAAEAVEARLFNVPSSARLGRRAASESNAA